MTITAYKEKRGKYKLVVYTEKYGVETFKVKGKKQLRRKIKAVKELYGDIPTV